VEPDEERAFAPPRFGSHRARRIALSLAVCIGVLAVAVPIGLCARHRYGHVVSVDALVKGHIADVGTRLDGVVTSMPVAAGDQVRAGQIVARLEDRHFHARVEQARSQLEKASRELEVERLAIAHERRRMDSSMTEATAHLAMARAEVQAAESRADDARQKHEVQRSLGEEGVTASEKVRGAGAERRTTAALVVAAQADQNAAGAALRSIEVESEGLAVREERVSVLEADVARFRAELAVAEADLEGTLIRAPDDGAVVRRIVEPGGSVVVGQPIISLWMGEDIWVEAWIDEDDLSQIEVGSLASVTLKSYPDREFSGVVEAIGVSTDFEMPDSAVPQPRHERMRGTPVVGVRVRLEESEEDLFPGLSGVVAIRKRDR
jgi:multidrug resistance efflux pump